MNLKPQFYGGKICLRKYAIQCKMSLLWFIGKTPGILDVLEQKFDLIICNHVLEHIPNELKALSELKRVLNNHGSAFITVPVCENAEVTLENMEYNTPELRRKFYGNSDHVRMYGKDFIDRLENAGFTVKKIFINEDYSKEELDLYGLYKNEVIYKCRN